MYLEYSIASESSQDGFPPLLTYRSRCNASLSDCNIFLIARIIVTPSAEQGAGLVAGPAVGPAARPWP